MAPRRPGGAGWVVADGAWGSAATIPPPTHMQRMWPCCLARCDGFDQQAAPAGQPFPPGCRLVRGSLAEHTPALPACLR